MLPSQTWEWAHLFLWSIAAAITNAEICSSSFAINLSSEIRVLFKFIFTCSTSLLPLQISVNNWSPPPNWDCQCLIGAPMSIESHKNWREYNQATDTSQAKVSHNPQKCYPWLLSPPWPLQWHVIKHRYAIPPLMCLPLPLDLGLYVFVAKCKGRFDSTLFCRNVTCKTMHLNTILIAKNAIIIVNRTASNRLVSWLWRNI